MSWVIYGVENLGPISLEESQMNYSMTTNAFAHFNPVGLESDGSPGDLEGATLTIQNNNTDIVTASFETDGRLKIAPVGVAGVAVVTLLASVAGVFISGSLTINVSLPIPPATQIGFMLADTNQN